MAQLGIRYALSGEEIPRLIFVLLRDSFIYHGGMIVIMVTTCVMWAVGRVSVNHHFSDRLVGLT